MFSKLVFNIDGNTVELHAHEVVQFARKLLDEEPGEKISLLAPNDFDTYFDGLLAGETPLEELVIGTLDAALYTPISVLGMKTLKQWLFVAKYFQQNQSLYSNIGWWLEVNGRQLLIKNTDQYQFYVSDHGKKSHIVGGICSTAIGFAWLSDPSILIRMQEIIKTESELGKKQLKNERKKAVRKAKKKSLRELAQRSPDVDVAKLPDMKNRFINQIERNGDYWWKHISEIHRYMLGALAKKYQELKQGQYKGFDIRVYLEYLQEPAKADLIIKKMVLAQLAKDINQGKHEPLFRPVHSYGSPDMGSAYHVFASDIVKYFEKEDHLKPEQLAQLVRRIMAGEEIELDSALIFLPNLIAAWFIAEGARNPLSSLTSIMLMDMIENKIKLPYDSRNNWYTWHNALIHPDNDAGASDNKYTIKDLYKQAKHPFKFGGIHPMAHTGSAEEAKRTFQDNVKLSTVQQKEGTLILHWLYVYIKKADPGFPVEIKTIDESPLLKTFEYNKLERIQKSIKRFTKDKNIKLQRDPNANVKKEEDKIQKLEAEVQAEQLLLKEKLKKNLIKPLLELRLGTLNNFFKTSDYTVSCIIYRFQGLPDYHFEQRPAQDLLEETIGLSIVEREDLIQRLCLYFKQKERYELLKAKKRDFDSDDEEFYDIIVRIFKCFTYGIIPQGYSLNFLNKMMDRFEKAKQIYSLKSNSHERDIDLLIKNAYYEEYYIELKEKMNDLYGKLSEGFASLGVCTYVFTDMYKKDADEVFYIKSEDENRQQAWHFDTFNPSSQDKVYLFISKEKGWGIIFPTMLGLNGLKYLAKKGPIQNQAVPTASHSLSSNLADKLIALSSRPTTCHMPRSLLFNFPHFKYRNWHLKTNSLMHSSNVAAKYIKCRK